MFIKANIYSNREQFDRWTRLDTKELSKRREFYFQILSDNQGTDIYFATIAL